MSKKPVGRPKDKYLAVHALNGKDMKDAVQIARDLLGVAKQAMPDTYYASDTRTNRARAFIKRMTGVNAH